MVSVVVLGFGLICIIFGGSTVNNPSAPDKFWYPEDNPEYGQIARRIVQTMGVLCMLFGAGVVYLAF